MELILSVLKNLFTEQLSMEARIIIFLCLCPLMFKFGLHYTIKFLKDFNHLKKLNKNAPLWPTTTGVIIESEVREGVTGGTEDSQIYHYLHLVYKYFVIGKEYYSPIFRMIEPLNDPERYCNKTVRKYPVNSEVEVFYNPEIHEECCLEPSSKSEIRRNWFLVLFLSVLLIVGFP